MKALDRLPNIGSLGSGAADVAKEQPTIEKINQVQRRSFLSFFALAWMELWLLAELARLLSHFLAVEDLGNIRK
jgi:hypothetical protein